MLRKIPLTSRLYEIPQSAACINMHFPIGCININLSISRPHEISLTSHLYIFFQSAVHMDFFNQHDQSAI